MSDCFICGMCWWNGCENDADWRMREGTTIKFRSRHSIDMVEIDAGKIELCNGHYRQWEADGRLNLKWIAIEQSLAARSESAL